MLQSCSLPAGSPAYPETLGCWADSARTGTPGTLRTPGSPEPLQRDRAALSPHLCSSWAACQVAVRSLRAPLMSRDQGPRVKGPRGTRVPSGSGDRLLDFMLRCYRDLAPSICRQLALEAEGKMLISWCSYSLVLVNGKRFSFATQSKHMDRKLKTITKLAEGIIYEWCLQFLWVKQHC